MPLENPEAGIGYAGEFQSSGLPWVISSTATVGNVQAYSLPKVSRAINVRNVATGSAANGYVAFGFTLNGVQGSNRFLIPPNQSETFEVRVKEFYITGVSGSVDYSIFAALTTVPAKNMPILTGSITGSFVWEGVG